MPVRDWIFVYMLIIGIGVWMVVPEKTSMFNAITLGTALLGFLLLKYYKRDRSN